MHRRSRLADPTARDWTLVIASPVSEDDEILRMHQQSQRRMDYQRRHALHAEARLLAQPAKVVDVLRRARALIADPARWTEGRLARDAAGRSVKPNDPRATQWCVVGAIKKWTPIWSAELPTPRCAWGCGDSGTSRDR
jgi:hypothetical protein